MIATDTPLSASLMAVVGLASLVGALMLRRLSGRSARRSSRLSAKMSARASTMAADFEAVRGHLVTIRAASETGLWSLARLDERTEATRTSLVRRREAMATARLQLQAAGTNIERIKSTARLVTRAIDLRRKILG